MEIKDFAIALHYKDVKKEFAKYLKYISENHSDWTIGDLLQLSGNLTIYAFSNHDNEDLEIVHHEFQKFLNNVGKKLKKVDKNER